MSSPRSPGTFLHSSKTRDRLICWAPSSVRLCDTRAMRHALIMLLLALSPATSFSQTATKVESQVAQEIAQCMVEGPPPDWTRLYMIIELPEPNAANGRARYVADRDFS